MRPQQNRRMRGRGGNNNNNNNNQNRKGPNPLTRSYESNGPDVKIRGSAQQIAEKYTTLARDAQSSGDRVMAENYLQHAEHYNRIIMAAQAQQQQQQQFRDNRDDDDGDDDGDDYVSDAPRAEQQPPQQQPRREHRPNPTVQEHQPDGSGPQPVIVGVPAEVALKQDAVGEVEVSVEASNETATVEAASGEGEDAEAAPARKPRRPRRPRVKAGEQAAGDDQAPTEEPVIEAAQ